MTKEERTDLLIELGSVRVAITAKKNRMRVVKTEEEKIDLHNEIDTLSKREEELLKVLGK